MGLNAVLSLEVFCDGCLGDVILTGSAELVPGGVPDGSLVWRDFVWLGLWSMENMEEFRRVIGKRDGITSRTVVFDDVTDAFVRELDGGGVDLAHAGPLVEACRALDRWYVKGRLVELRNAERELHGLEKVLMHQLRLIRMLKGRVCDERLRLKRIKKEEKKGEEKSINTAA